MSDLCFSKADILLPKSDLDKFAVIACDQFTSEPEYWENVRKFTSGYRSAYDLILPEIYLKADNSEQIAHVNRNINEYLSSGVFKEINESFIFVRRVQSDGAVRAGIIGKIDLSEYTYKAGGDGKIRSTEKTVMERIPARAQIRRDAAIELPHVMLLFDDKKDRIMSYLESRKEQLQKLYSFALYGGAGEISGYRLDGAASDMITAAFSDIERENDGLLFCVGDGNHSLAAAKSIYEQSGLERDRYALVEAVNIHSPAINFEPIYRVLFGVQPEEIIEDFLAYCAEKSGEYTHKFRCVSREGEREITVKSNLSLPVAALQDYLDNGKPDIKIDYIHGIESTKKIARSAEDTLGFIFDGMKKTELFGAVINDGALPRKTFSMGHALDKRFYLEARRIK